jgi:Transposase DDE domain
MAGPSTAGCLGAVDQGENPSQYYGVMRLAVADFVYQADEDTYLCPAGERLTYRFTTDEPGRRCARIGQRPAGLVRSRASAPQAERPIRRWEHEAILERVQQRLDDDPGKIPLRSRSVEHPFGTIKAWMSATHFKMKTLKHVATEMALHVLAYNMMRVAILGVPALMRAMNVVTDDIMRLPFAWAHRRGSRPLESSGGQKS